MLGTRDTSDRAPLRRSRRSLRECVRHHSQAGTTAGSRTAARLSSGGTLLDQVMPEFDFGNRHEIVVAAPLARAAEAVETYRLDSSGLVRLLFWLRGLGKAPGTLRASMIASGFTLLGETPGEEIVLGVAGRFWALNERAHLSAVADRQAFVQFNRPGSAKAAVNIRLEALSEKATRITTETRVHCLDAAAYRRFALYWAVIKPFSAWIRRDMLRGFRRHALSLQGDNHGRT